MRKWDIFGLPIVILDTQYKCVYIIRHEYTHAHHTHTHRQAQARIQAHANICMPKGKRTADVTLVRKWEQVLYNIIEICEWGSLSRLFAHSHARSPLDIVSHSHCVLVSLPFIHIQYAHSLVHTIRTFCCHSERTRARQHTRTHKHLSQATTCQIAGFTLFLTIRIQTNHHIYHNAHWPRALY